LAAAPRKPRYASRNRVPGAHNAPRDAYGLWDVSALILSDNLRQAKSTIESSVLHSQLGVDRTADENELRANLNYPSPLGRRATVLTLMAACSGRGFRRGAGGHGVVNSTGGEVGSSSPGSAPMTPGRMSLAERATLRRASTEPRSDRPSAVSRSARGFD
jgi:hypothetical protein